MDTRGGIPTTAVQRKLKITTINEGNSNQKAYFLNYILLKTSIQINRQEVHDF